MLGVCTSAPSLPCQGHCVARDISAAMRKTSGMQEHWPLDRGGKAAKEMGKIQSRQEKIQFFPTA